MNRSKTLRSCLERLLEKISSMNYDIQQGCIRDVNAVMPAGMQYSYNGNLHVWACDILPKECRLAYREDNGIWLLDDITTTGWQVIDKYAWAEEFMLCYTTAREQYRGIASRSTYAVAA